MYKLQKTVVIAVCVCGHWEKGRTPLPGNHLQVGEGLWAPGSPEDDVLLMFNCGADVAHPDGDNGPCTTGRSIWVLRSILSFSIWLHHYHHHYLDRFMTNHKI